MSSLVFYAFPQRAHPLILPLDTHSRRLGWCSPIESHVWPNEAVIDLVHIPLLAPNDPPIRVPKRYHCYPSDRERSRSSWLSAHRSLRARLVATFARLGPASILAAEDEIYQKMAISQAS